MSGQTIETIPSKTAIKSKKKKDSKELEELIQENEFYMSVLEQLVVPA